MANKSTNWAPWIFVGLAALGLGLAAGKIEDVMRDPVLEESVEDIEGETWMIRIFLKGQEFTLQMKGPNDADWADAGECFAWKTQQAAYNHAMSLIPS